MIDDTLLYKRSSLIVNMLVGEKASNLWWTSPNRAFNGLTPDEYWVLDYAKVYGYLLNQVDGGDW